MDSRRLTFGIVLACSIAMAVAVSCAGAGAQDNGSQGLARLLANEDTRAGAITGILATGRARLPLLLSWTQKPPAEVDEYELDIGLAEVFGQLKAKEAVPFLVESISRRRTREVDFAPWLKTDEVIEWTFPSAAALIQIGPDASRELIRAARGPMRPADRLAAIFVISRIKGIPEAAPFLASAINQANAERYRAEEGLKLLDESHTPVK